MRLKMPAACILLLFLAGESLSAQPCWDSIFFNREEFENKSTGASLVMLVRVYEDCPVERQVLLHHEVDPLRRLPESE